MKETFGQFVYRLRMEKRITFRAFCDLAGVDPATHSEVERGLIPPHGVVLKDYARALGLAEDSEEARELERLAREEE